MPDFKKMFDDMLALVKQLDLTKKIIIGSAFLTILAALFLVAMFSSKENSSVLFKDLDVKDFAQITTKLGEMNYKYSTSGTSTIFISPSQREEAIVALAQENMIPQGVHGWDLFDEDKWSETQFEKDIKKQRALMGSLSRMISKIKSIEQAEVNIAFPEENLFEESALPVTASVLLKYAPGVESLDKKVVRGIVTLVSRAIPGLTKENVSIADPDGNIISDLDNDIDKEKWELKAVTEKLKIQEKERIKLLSDINKSLTSQFGVDRSTVVRLDVMLRWDKEEIERSEVEPVVMTPDDPNTPYSERVVQDSLEVSSKTTRETFQGNGFTPEGPAGTEPNIPPGYKDRDYQKATYDKQETIRNNEFNKTSRKILKQPWELTRVNLAVILDGKWHRKGIKEDGSGYIREYEAVSDQELADVTDVLKKAVGYSIARGDQISVKQIAKDRTKEFDLEDEELRKKRAFKKMLMATLISLLSIVILTIIYQVARKEIDKRRRLKSEELAAQQAMMREAALRAIEDEGVEVEISLEEKARKEMIENAINLAKDRPEEVAQLIRTWLAEE